MNKYIDAVCIFLSFDKLFNSVCVAAGIAGGFFSYLLGGWDALLKTILMFACLDYFSGCIKWIYEKKLSSEIGFFGLLKKMVMFAVIAAAYWIQELINNAVPLREVVIWFYISNEAISLLENAAIFIPIPQQLKNILLQIREKAEKESEEK